MDSHLHNLCAGSSVAPAQLAKTLGNLKMTSHAGRLRGFSAVREPLYIQASRARERAFNWREFHVGCAVWAYRSDLPVLEGGVRPFYGTSTKVTSKSHKVCAECVALLSAYLMGYTEVIGMVVVAFPQHDDHSGIKSQTLHPCWECRDTMNGHPIMQPHTQILTAHPPPHDVWERQTLRQLLRLHRHS